MNDELCDIDERIAFLQKQISTLARHRDMLCEPSVFIEQSNVVRINSCKVRLLVPPVLVITSAALYGLSRQELTWLLATEMSRLDRGASSLAHRNKAMHISSVIYALFVGPFKIMGCADGLNLQ